MTFKNKNLKIITLILCGIIGTYFILNNLIVLDRTNQELGIYDFVKSSADVELLVEGTGRQNIMGETVSTKLKIIKIQWNKTSHNLVEGSEIEANEYFVVHKNRQVSGLQFIPGRSIYSMGTSYKRLGIGEQKTIDLRINKETNQLWIMPEEHIKQ
ncbi:hypothetical protein [Paenibacillus sp. FSL H7-0331]|uniref:hypothetical protein n=1 Tax=Paenibacillus sp. FSL H7-0331 TaxID=1920421 RepID=UPI00096C9EAD|nr:hypothetical protein [Paenibacillus sp. FSL H7-0331]OMF02611.1 hypothetical protein BK127_37005 [Paenibacillus sp. FSL H7-0331]